MLETTLRNVVHTASLAACTLVTVTVDTTQSLITSCLVDPLVVLKSAVVGTETWDMTLTVARVRRTLVTVTIATSVLTVRLLSPCTIHTLVSLVAHTFELPVGTVDTLTILTECGGRTCGVSTVVRVPGVVITVESTVIGILVTVVPALCPTLVSSGSTAVTVTRSIVALVAATQLVWINVSSVAVEAISLTTRSAVLCIDTSTVTRLLAVTLAVTGVVTTAGTGNGVPLVELTVRTTVACLTVRTHIGVRGTTVTNTVRTSVRTVLREYPRVGLADEDVTTNTLHRASGTRSNTLTVLTDARHVRGVTTVVTARPIVLLTSVMTVTAVAVPTTPACSVTLVGSELTGVTFTTGSVTTEGATQRLRINVGSVTVHIVVTATTALELREHTCT